MDDPLLQIDDLTYTYSDGTEALRGIDLAVRCGEKVGLIGQNGSGKSTLLMCVSGLFIGEGTIRVDSMELSASRAKAIRGRVGLVFQSPDDQLFMPTLADDLAFGPINLGLGDNEVNRRVEVVAAQMNLTALLDRPPHHLSMGQKRSGAIASVLAMQPALLLMDEPASNLDPRSRRRLIDVLAGLDATMLIASHDLAMVSQLCSRVALLDEGRVVTEGPTVDVLANEPLMQQHGLECWQPAPG